MRKPAEISEIERRILHIILRTHDQWDIGCKKSNRPRYLAQYPNYHDVIIITWKNIDDWSFHAYMTFGIAIT
jgi:hypothetical protein